MLRWLNDIVVGTCFILLGGIGLWFCMTMPVDEESLDKQIEMMPDYDYLSEIRELEAEGRLGEAEHLSDWVLSGSSITNRDEVFAAREEINRKRTAFWGRTKRVVKGFVVGDGASVEELGGAVVSDFLLWGDIRDLAKQGYNKVTGKETDPVIAALAAIGVCTSVMSFWVADPAEGAEVAADASLSFLKTLRKMGQLSNKFCDVIVAASRESVKAKSASKGLKELVVGTKTLFESVGAARAATVMKQIDDVDSLKAVSKMAKQAAEPIMILVRKNGADGVKALRGLADVENGVGMLEKATRKGPLGIRKLLKHAKYGARGAKSFGKGNVQRFSEELMKSVGRGYAGLISFALLLIGSLQLRIWRVFRSMKRSPAIK